MQGVFGVEPELWWGRGFLVLCPLPTPTPNCHPWMLFDKRKSSYQSIKRKSSCPCHGNFCLCQTVTTLHACVRACKRERFHFGSWQRKELKVTCIAHLISKKQRFHIWHMYSLFMGKPLQIQPWILNYHEHPKLEPLVLLVTTFQIMWRNFSMAKSVMKKSFLHFQKWAAMVFEGVCFLESEFCFLAVYKLTSLPVKIYAKGWILEVLWAAPDFWQPGTFMLWAFQLQTESWHSALWEVFEVSTAQDKQGKPIWQRGGEGVPTLNK